MHAPSASRRLVLKGLGGCALCGALAPSRAALQPGSMMPLVSPGYAPSAPDERGMWHAFDRLEQEMASSSMVLRNPDLSGYLKGVAERLIGPHASDMRIYVVRNPDFNASMAPNGLMIVHTGLLVRVRSEAQLASILGHEAGHYLRLHSVRSWRQHKTKTAAMAVIALGGVAATGVTGHNWYDLANSINNALLLSLFSFSRDMEREADAYGLHLLDEAGYPPDAAAEAWAQLIAEFRASAAARKKRHTDYSRSAFSTHPPTEDRMTDLGDAARAMRPDDGSAGSRDDGRVAYRASIAPVRGVLLEEVVRLNDPGSSLYLITSLASEGWDGTLRFYEGEAYRLRDATGDPASAAQAYAEAVSLPDPPVDAYRAHGYAQIKLGNHDVGRGALQRYLELNPLAKDAAMVRFSLAQQPR